MARPWNAIAFCPEFVRHLIWLTLFPSHNVLALLTVRKPIKHCTTVIARTGLGKAAVAYAGGGPWMTKACCRLTTGFGKSGKHAHCVFERNPRPRSEDSCECPLFALTRKMSFTPKLRPARAYHAQMRVLTFKTNTRAGEYDVVWRCTPPNLEFR